MRKVTVISGPTCSGKSDAALKFALENDAEIISCDSVQIYRGMDIGSAKPSKAELAAVRHHLIDVADVCEKFDVAKYVELARAALDDILSRGKKVVVCGGSGFYLRSWFAPVADTVAIPDDIKKISERIERDSGAAGLAAALEKIDADAPKFIDMKNPRRTKNALERCMASGRGVEALLKDFSSQPSPMGELEKELILLDRPDAEMRGRIRMRTADMLARGLIEETRSLMGNGLALNPSARAAIGYRETVEWIESGGTDISELAGTIEKNTFALVRKQRKYFRGSLTKTARRELS